MRIYYTIYFLAFCLYSTMAQDTCVDALEVTLTDNCVSSTYSNAGLTASMIMPGLTCHSVEPVDSWFVFEVPTDGAFVAQTTIVELDDMVMQAYIGDCNNLVVLDCNNDSGNGGQARISRSEMVAGEKVYLRIADFESDDIGDFGLCVYTPDLETGNVCDYAVPLPVGPSCDLRTINNSFVTASNTLIGCIGSNIDFWFYVEVPSTGSFTIETGDVANGADDMIMQLYSGSCGGLIEVICDDDSGPGRQSLININSATPGDIYYLQVAASSPVQVPIFGICAYEREAIDGGIGDLCSTAHRISPQVVCQEQVFENFMKTNSGEGQGFICGQEGQGFDTWFVTTIPPSGNLIIETTVPLVSDAIDDHVIQVYSGECSALSFLDCNDDFSFGLESQVVLRNRIPGEQIYFELVEYGSSEEGYFGVCAYDPSAVDGDGDGWSVADDCDDEDSSVNPSAEDVPNNGIDEDCDGDDLSATHNIGSQRVDIYPNPTSGVVNVLMENYDGFVYRVIDLNGRFLDSGVVTKEINLSIHPDGIYILELLDFSSQVFVLEKVVLNR